MTQPNLHDEHSPVALVHPSNLLTYAAVVIAATGAVLATVLGNVPAAGAAMALAVIADTFDGKFSRRFTRTPFQSAFGVQLDSLADAITSGFVPVMVMSTTAIGAETWRFGFWTIAAFAYVVAALTRLGYYNLTESSRSYFVGLPAPAATLFVSTALLFDPGAVASAFVLIGCAIAMLSPFHIPRPRGRGLLLFAVWALLLIALHVQANRA